MPIHHLLFLIALSFAPRQDCTTWQACRDEATAAAARQDYERFHDLAWRAVQRGPKNDPALMLLLARAQSLSGRPTDALVMLERLAALGVATDAATSDDFRRVRALPRWPEVEQRLTENTAPASESKPETKPDSPLPPKPDVKAEPKAAKPDARAPSTDEPAEAARFAAPGLTPDGLAYDRVSRRFLLADRNARKLVVVDEFSRNVATLAGAQAAFGDIEALEIDSRLGDLWVVSSEPLAAGGATTLHKLQLVSGRVLATFTPGPALGPARFTDVALANGSAVLVLDSLGSRVLKLRGGALESTAVAPPGAMSLAPTENGSLYVAATDGIWRIDGSGTLTAVKSPQDSHLGGLARIRYHHGALLAWQRAASGGRLLRLVLDRAGRAVTSVDVLDATDTTAGAFAVSGESLFYYASRQGGEAVLRKVALDRVEKRP